MKYIISLSISVLTISFINGQNIETLKKNFETALLQKHWMGDSSAVSCFQQIVHTGEGKQLEPVLKTQLVQSLQIDADASVNAFWNGNMGWPSKNIQSSLQAIKALELLEQPEQNKTGNIGIDKAVLQVYLFYVSSYFECSLIIPAQQKNKLIKSLISLNNEYLAKKNTDKNEALLYAANGLLYRSIGNDYLFKIWFEKALSLFPSWAFALERVGEVADRLNDTATAIKYLQKAIVADSTLLHSYYILGWLYANETNNLNAATKLANEAIAIDSNYYYLYSLKSTIAGKKKDTLNQRLFLEKAIRTNTKWVTGYDNLCNYYRKRKDYNKAIAMADEALKINPYNEDIYNTLARIHLDQRDTASAFAVFKREMFADPTSSSPYESTGNIYYNSGEYENALSYYKGGLKVNDSDFNCNYDVGLCYYELYQYNLALSYYEKAMALDSTNTSSYNAIGNVYYAKYEYRTALSYHIEGLKYNNFDFYCNANAGDDYYSLKNYDSCIYFYKKAIKADPNNTNMYNKLGNVYHDKYSDYASALYCYSKGLETNDSDYSCNYNTGLCNYNLKNYDTAIKYFQKAYSINGTTTNALIEIAYIYTAKNQPATSIDYWEKIINQAPADKQNISAAGLQYAAVADSLLKNKDVNQAIVWLRRGAKIGNRSCANTALALMYENGIELEKNYPLAMQFYKMGAEKIYCSKICYDGIIRLYEKHLVPIDSSDYNLYKKLLAFPYETLSLNCIMPDGSENRLTIYVNYVYPEGENPLQKEAERIKEESKAKIEYDELSTVSDFYSTAVNNNYSFRDYCMYRVYTYKRDNLKEMISNARLSDNISDENNLYKRLIDNDTTLASLINTIRLDESSDSSIIADIREYVSDDYNDYGNYLKHINNDSAILQFKKAVYYNSTNDSAAKNFAEINFEKNINNASFLIKQASLPQLFYYIDHSLEKNNKKEADTITAYILSHTNTAADKAKIYTVYKKYGYDNFDKLLLSDIDSLIVFRDYFFDLDPGSKDSALTIIKYETLIKLDLEVLKNYKKLKVFFSEKDITDSVVEANIKSHISEDYADFGHVLVNADKNDSAELLFKKALELDPTDSAAIEYRAKARFNFYHNDISELMKHSETTDAVYYIKFYVEKDEPQMADSITQMIIADGFYKKFLLTFRNYVFKNVTNSSYHEERIYKYKALTKLDEAVLQNHIQNIQVQAASDYNDFGWYCLLARETDKAAAAITRGLELDTSNIYLKGNLPHILLFTGKKEKARELYLKLKDQLFDDGTKNKTYKDSFLGDFEDFENSGLYTDFNFNEMRRWLNQ